jgi:hypothetical protein
LENPVPDHSTSTLAAAKLEVMRSCPYVQKHKTAGLTYSFAGEADLIASLRPALLRHGLSVAPVKVTVLEQGRYQTVKGSLLNHVLVAVVYRLTHAASGEAEECEVLGEASDAGDKAAPKAMTGAMKYFLRQTFLIETGDDPDRSASEEQEAAVPGNAELVARLTRFDTRLAAAGLSTAGACLAYVLEKGKAAGLPPAIERWPERATQLAQTLAREFHRQAAGQKKATVNA